jgi:hypothetical protein
MFTGELGIVMYLTTKGLRRLTEERWHEKQAEEWHRELVSTPFEKLSDFDREVVENIKRNYPKYYRKLKGKRDEEGSNRVKWRYRFVLGFKVRD